YPRERRQVDLNDVVRAALGSVALALRADAVEVTLALAPELPPIAADRAQLLQTVANLVANAHEALRGVPGPRQLILATRLELPAGRRAGDAMLTEPPAPGAVANSPRSGTAVAEPGAPPMPSPRRPGRILLVEDETPVAQVLAELFAIDGHEVDVARDGGI